MWSNSAVKSVLRAYKLSIDVRYVFLLMQLDSPAS